MESVHLHNEEEQQHSVYGKQNTTSRGICREYGPMVVLLLCIALIMTAVFVGSFGLAKSNQVQAQVQQELSLRQEIAQHDAEVLPFMSKSIALTDAYKTGKPRILSLCTMASYYQTNNNTSRFVSLDKTTIDEVCEEPLKNYNFYHVSVKLRLTFTELLKKKKLKTTGILTEAKTKAILLEYNVTSNFAAFTTVKLQELEFDTYHHSLNALRTIVLCSNAPNALAEKCDRAAIGNSLFIMHGEEELSFDIPQMAPTEEVNETEKTDIHNIRMYNLVFYHLEEKILTIEPNKCH